jgi:hypothetical protein
VCVCVFVYTTTAGMDGDRQKKDATTATPIQALTFSTVKSFLQEAGALKGAQWGGGTAEDDLQATF